MQGVGLKRKRVDVLVVGQGLAGTQVAWSLVERGLRVLVLDGGHEEAASRVAAGVLNPVTGQRLVLSWQAEQHVEFAKRRYREQEKRFGAVFLREVLIQRVVRSEAEWVRWEKRRADPAYGAFLGGHESPGSVPGCRDEPWGSFAIRGAAVLETKRFLAVSRRWFLEAGLLREEVVDVDQVRLVAGGVRWKDVEAERVVFCQGWGGRGNRWFGGLPFQWAKGETVLLGVPGHGLDRVIHREKWVLPEEGDRVRVGSTFEWDRQDREPTVEAARELRGAAVAMLGLGQRPEVVGQEAGVRPCSHDTRPYLGRSWVDDRVWVANGFGSKGALTTPLCGWRLAGALVGELELGADEDVRRVGRF